MMYYSQRNPVWGNLELDGSGLKMKDFGCYLTALACYDGRSPDCILKLLNDHNCITSEGLLKNEQAALTLGYTYYKVDKNPQKICIARIDYSPAPGIQTHFVVWLNDKDGNIIDVWDGLTKKNHWSVCSYRVFEPIYPARPPEIEARATITMSKKPGFIDNMIGAIKSGGVKTA